MGRGWRGFCVVDSFFCVVGNGLDSFGLLRIPYCISGLSGLHIYPNVLLVWI